MSLFTFCLTKTAGNEIMRTVNNKLGNIRIVRINSSGKFILLLPGYFKLGNTKVRCCFSVSEDQAEGTATTNTS